MRGIHQRDARSGASQHGKYATHTTRCFAHAATPKKEATCDGFSCFLRETDLREISFGGSQICFTLYCSLLAPWSYGFNGIALGLG